MNKTYTKAAKLIKKRWGHSWALYLRQKRWGWWAHLLKSTAANAQLMVVTAGTGSPALHLHKKFLLAVVIWVSYIPRTVGGHPKPTAASQIPFPTKWTINFLSGFIGITLYHFSSSWCHHHQSQSSSCLGFCRKCTDHFCIIHIFLRALSEQIQLSLFGFFWAFLAVVNLTHSLFLC